MWSSTHSHLTFAYPYLLYFFFFKFCKRSFTYVIFPVPPLNIFEHCGQSLHQSHYIFELISMWSSTHSLLTFTYPYLLYIFGILCLALRMIAVLNMWPKSPSWNDFHLKHGEAGSQTCPSPAPSTNHSHPMDLQPWKPTTTTVALTPPHWHRKASIRSPSLPPTRAVPTTPPAVFLPLAYIAP